MDASQRGEFPARLEGVRRRFEQWRRMRRAPRAFPILCGPRRHRWPAAMGFLEQRSCCESMPPGSRIISVPSQRLLADRRRRVRPALSS